MLAVATTTCSKKGNLALVKVEGTIVTADKTIDQLEEARLDPEIKAVLLRIDSPGGAVAASQEILEEVKKVDAEKPVVVSMGDVAASGGYYIACGARKIFANSGTITGSIGVRMEHLNIKELLNWAKISHETLKSGEFKDIGNPDRPMTKEERALLQSVLGNLHDQFKTAVAEARHLTKEKVDKLADGRIYSGEQAKELGLVDELGGLSVAMKATAELGKIKGEPKVKSFEKESPWWIRYFVEESVKGMKEIISSVQARRFL